MSTGYNSKFSYPLTPITGADIIDLTGVAGDKEVLYASGSEIASDPNFVFNYENGRLGVGTANPQFPVHIVGDTSITGTLYATEYHVNVTSASIIYDSGSHKFGDSSDDVHQFTGSIEHIGLSLHSGSLFEQRGNSIQGELLEHLHQFTGSIAHSGSTVHSGSFLT